MIQSIQFQPNPRLTAIFEKAGLKGKQISEAIQFTTESVLQVIKEQLKRGNLQEVLAILKGKPLALGRKLVKEEIISRVVKGLMFKFGLRKFVALGIAAILVPFIIAKVAQQLLKQNHHLSDLLHSLQIKTKLQDLLNQRPAEIKPDESLLISQELTYEQEFLTD